MGGWGRGSVVTQLISLSVCGRHGPLPLFFQTLSRTADEPSTIQDQVATNVERNDGEGKLVYGLPSSIDVCTSDTELVTEVLMKLSLTHFPHLHRSSVRSPRLPSSSHAARSASLVNVCLPPPPPPAPHDSESDRARLSRTVDFTS
jgi:predicted small lipoprotein YifL